MNHQEKLHCPKCGRDNEISMNFGDIACYCGAWFLFLKGDSGYYVEELDKGFFKKTSEEDLDPEISCYLRSMLTALIRKIDYDVPIILPDEEEISTINVFDLGEGLNNTTPSSSATHECPNCEAPMELSFERGELLENGADLYLRTCVGCNHGIAIVIHSSDSVVTNIHSFGMEWWLLIFDERPAEADARLRRSLEELPYLSGMDFEIHCSDSTLRKNRSTTPEGSDLDHAMDLSPMNVLCRACSQGIEVSPKRFLLNSQSGNAFFKACLNCRCEMVITITGDGCGGIVPDHLWVNWREWIEECSSRKEALRVLRQRLANHLSIHEENISHVDCDDWPEETDPGNNGLQIGVSDGAISSAEEAYFKLELNRVDWDALGDEPLPDPSD